MDRELAGAVLGRWREGLPVYETALYKAASVLGIDPQAALMEARFYTHLDRYLLEKRAMRPFERKLFSAAAGFDSQRMVKTASQYRVSPDQLILESLRRREFVPDLEKLANLSAVGGDPTVAQAGGAAQPEMGGMPQGQGDMPALAAPPQPGQAVQQNPQARFKPSPMAPEQVPPDANGNLDALLQQHQDVFGQQAQDNGGMPPAGQPEPPPPPPSPEERIQQVFPDADEETLARYGQHLTEFEQQIGMPVSDPKSMVKFVKELQKVDAKRVDQGMKAYGQQLEQQQAAELGIGQPTVTNTVKMPGASGAAGAVGGGPQAQVGAPGGQGAPGNATKPPRPAPQPQQAAQAAVEKVANAGRALARSQFRSR